MEAMIEEDCPLGLGSSLNAFVDEEDIGGIIRKVDSVEETEALIEKFTEVLSRYQEQPHLIDPYLPLYFERLNSVILNESHKVRRLASHLAVVLIKVRGYKRVLKFMPHESHLLVKVLSSLEELNKNEPWEVQYVLLLMMSMLILVPFKMDVLLHTENTSLSERIYSSTLPFLMTLSASQDAAVLLMAKFATRKDALVEYLPKLIEHCTQKLGNIQSGDFSTTMAGLGGLKTLCAVYKYGGKRDLIPFATKVFSSIKDLLSSNNTLIRKFYLKLMQRVVLNFLPAKVCSWKWKKTLKTLLLSEESPMEDNLKGKEKEEEELSITEEESIIFERVIQDLLDGLKDKDTTVRWSAAKGMGRICNHIPKEFCDDIISSIISLFSFRETDNAWHGGCLALAELARRGLITSSRLKSVMPVINTALLYDERRGCFSVGAHVRDAACYVCWSFSRSYNRETLEPYKDKFASALLCVMLFDREITCRRAASATFQEIVGRQALFAHGIEILSKTDFYSVGNRTHTYLNLSVEISKYPEYGLPLFLHVLGNKTNHWDINIRELASQSLKNLMIYPANMQHSLKSGLKTLFDSALASEDVRIIHGAALGISEIIGGIVINHGISCVKPFYSDIKKLSLSISEKIRQSSLGKELLDLALLALIKKCSESFVLFDNVSDIIYLWQPFIDECVHSTDVKVREHAIDTISPFFKGYYVDPVTKEVLVEKRSGLIDKYISYIDHGHISREGFTLALGHLPYVMLRGKMKIILNALCKATTITEATSKWAEARRNAIHGISQIVVTMTDNEPLKEFEDSIPLIFDSLINGLNDYTVERRGDVGAWVREAAMSGLYSFTAYCHKISYDCSKHIPIFSPLIARQAVEKIDRTRSLAAKTFVKLVRDELMSKHVPEIERVGEIFQDISDDFSWSLESETFPLFAKLVRLKSYAYHIISGLIVSIGGVSFSLVKHASGSLFTEINDEDEALVNDFVQNVIQVLVNNPNDDRIVTPFFGFIKHLVEAGNIDCALRNYASKIFSIMNGEMSSCRDPKKLIAFIDAICALFQIGDKETQCLIYKKLVVYLCHRYPRIRKITSCKLYEVLTIADVEVLGESELASIMEVLDKTAWDSSDVKLLQSHKKTLLSYVSTAN